MTPKNSAVQTKWNLRTRIDHVLANDTVDGDGTDFEDMALIAA